MTTNSNLLWTDIQKIKSQAPLIHNITNFVVMNNTANALLAFGASPVMAHAEEEVEDMVGIASALVINIGTLSEPWVASMRKAMKRAKALNKPIVFDPVGAGATPYRTKTILDLISDAPPTIIRGNSSEIKALVSASGKTKGVDSTESSETAVDAGRELCKKYNAVVSISGETDYITDGERTIAVRNGVPLLTKVTGMGCTATALTAAFAAINPSALVAAVHGMAITGIAGEIAMKDSRGPGSLQAHFLDTLYSITETYINEHLKVLDV
ncbi:MAG: hydroxyethylthiazole kinase [Chlorobiales bacterium]|nr:hydroxyethylthiazole kinase [Chlorobiales bacterium]